MTARAKPNNQLIIDEIAHGLLRLQNTPQFALIGTLAAQSFFKGLNKLSPAVTVDELTHLSREQLTALKLPAKSLKLLASRLSELAPKLEGVEEELEEHLPYNEPEEPVSSGATLNSVDAERILTSTIESIIQHPELKRFGHKRLGMFWKKEWLRAPFEEELTLSQLSTMSARAILNKRSMTSDKILHIRDAVADALRGEKTEALHSKESAPKQLASWDLSKVPLSFQSIAHSFLLEAQGTSPARFLVEPITEKLSADKYVILALASDYDRATIASLLKLKPDDVGESTRVARLALREVLTTDNSGIGTAIAALCEGLGTGTVAFKKFFSDTPAGQTFSKVVASLW